MAWRTGDQSTLPESAQQPLRAEFVRLSRLLGALDGGIFNYDNEVARDPYFAMEMTTQLSTVKGQLELLEVSFLREPDKKNVKTFEESKAESMGRKQRRTVPKGAEGRDRQYIETKRGIEDLYFAVRARYDSLADVFKQNNFFEDAKARLRAEDIPNQ